ncbi:GspH/FimT family pseudopilin [Desulforhopalus singaporensis]|uniref:Type II secretion system protein H n=1 Tax=Desulforhopalus singaporensis TaxID=91360 RepID=A0A1H0QP87_9BACT|nr:prepilin-type N-terminal cleavage/methylation domain-containing protein [Desulforhopalus singaporensis]SDP19183.1 Type II transport protein GspH [Desulforhopalus singaporensis]
MKKDQITTTGFTLIEIMVAMAIIALFAIFAAPAMVKLGPNMKLRQAAMDLHSNLQKMKLEAVKRNRKTQLNITMFDCSSFPSSSVPSPGGLYTISVDEDGNATTIDEYLELSDDSGDSAPDTDYDMTPGTALCKNYSTPNGVSVFFFTPDGLWSEDAAFELHNNKGSGYKISVSKAGAITTHKLP